MTSFLIKNLILSLGYDNYFYIIVYHCLKKLQSLFFCDIYCLYETYEYIKELLGVHNVLMDTVFIGTSS
jgi:hypothetical protein